MNKDKQLSRRRLLVMFLTSFIFFILFSIAITLTNEKLEVLAGLAGFFISFIMWIIYLTLLMEDAGVI